MKNTLSNPRLRGLDTLRAIAVLVVVLYHLTIFGELPERLLAVTYYGWMGVDLFFVLSGFLIARQLFEAHRSGERLSIAEFYRRRAYRILPAYLCVLALYVLVPEWREYPYMASLWRFLTFTMNFGFSFSHRAFSHAWSLCVEEHFYLVLPLLAAVMMRRPSLVRTISVIGAVVVFGIGLRAWLVAHAPNEIWERAYYPSYTRLDGLVAGVSLAAVHVFRPVWWRRMMEQAHALLVAGAVCVGGVVWMFRGQDLGNNEGPARWGVIVGFPLLALGLSLITASAMSRNGWLARAQVPGAGMLAMLAFSLYLTHKPVAHFVMVRFSGVTKAQGPASWVLYAVTCMGAAVLLHYGVERPFLRLRDRSLGRAVEMEMRVDPAL